MLQPDCSCESDVGDMGPSPWHIEQSKEDGKLYLFKNGSRMKAEGNFKDSDRLWVSYVLNGRRHKDDKQYIVVSIHSTVCNNIMLLHYG